MQKQSRVLPNLNSVRAIAALMVVICHLELRKPGNLAQVKPLLAFGGIGVSIFFVLSGFLITYLLLKEKQANGSIKIKDFYIRRILRIWPLYFLILSFGYFVVPYIMPDYYQSSPGFFTLKGFFLNAFFLTSVTFVLKLTPVIISIIWSIGIEEQFYIFWPWIVKSNTAKAVRLVLVVFAAIPVLKILTMGILLFYKQPWLKDVSGIISTSRFDLMAAGGLCAFIGYYGNIRIGKLTIRQQFIQFKPVQLISLAGFFCCVVLICIGFQPEVIPSFLAIFTAVLLSNLALNKNVIIRLQNKPFDYLGKISYGIYLWHMPVIYCINRYTYYLFYEEPVLTQNILLYCLGIASTIVIASVSYYFFEKPFLQLKNRFVHTS